MMWGRFGEAGEATKQLKLCKSDVYSRIVFASFQLARHLYGQRNRDKKSFISRRLPSYNLQLCSTSRWRQGRRRPWAAAVTAQRARDLCWFAPPPPPSSPPQPSPSCHVWLVSTLLCCATPPRSEERAICISCHPYRGQEDPRVDWQTQLKKVTNTPNSASPTQKRFRQVSTNKQTNKQTNKSATPIDWIRMATTFLVMAYLQHRLQH